MLQKKTRFSTKEILSPTSALLQYHINTLPKEICIFITMTTTPRSTGQAFHQQTDNGISVESNSPQWQRLRAVFIIYRAVLYQKYLNWNVGFQSACLSSCFVRQNIIFCVRLVRNIEKIAFQNCFSPGFSPKFYHDASSQITQGQICLAALATADCLKLSRGQRKILEGAAWCAFGELGGSQAHPKRMQHSQHTELWLPSQPDSWHSILLLNLQTGTPSCGRLSEIFPLRIISLSFNRKCKTCTESNLITCLSSQREIKPSPLSSFSPHKSPNDMAFMALVSLFCCSYFI